MEQLTKTTKIYTYDELGPGPVGFRQSWSSFEALAHATLILETESHDPGRVRLTVSVVPKAATHRPVETFRVVDGDEEAALWIGQRVLPRLAYAVEVLYNPPLPTEEEG